MQTYFLLFQPVNYLNDYNPYNEFKICLSKYYKENDRSALQYFYEKMVFTKTTQWQHEQELRFCKYSIAAFEGFIPKHENVTNETCEELKRYSEKSIIT